jgi:hypothetical protein
MAITAILPRRAAMLTCLALGPEAMIAHGWPRQSGHE